MSAEALQQAVKQLAAGGALSASEAAAAFGDIMRGEGSPALISALLIGLRVKGESPEEVAGAARALREAMIPLPVERPDELVDTCGTGGGRIATFNISTAAALVAAGAGVRIAKHGNRSFTSQCGSADVLEALGVNIEVPVEVMARALAQAGIVFMFAPRMHPAMRHVGPVRRELAIPTVMNIIGPLANPARAGRQVVGVAEARRLPLIAGALAELGSVHALIVHGEPGMDEVSPLGPTHVMEVRGDRVREWEIRPERFGLLGNAPAELSGGPPAANAAVVEDVLAGGGTPGARAAVLLNAAAALYVAGVAPDYGAGIEVARTALDGGKGIDALRRLREAFGAAGAMETAPAARAQ